MCNLLCGDVRIPSLDLSETKIQQPILASTSAYVIPLAIFWLSPTIVLATMTACFQISTCNSSIYFLNTFMYFMSYHESVIPTLLV